MKSTVIILLSDKRSGSTMFEKELCKHPKISNVNYSPHTYNETHHWLKAACILERPESEFYGGKLYRGYGTRSGARRYLIDCVRGNAPEFVVPQNDHTLVFEGWNTLCRRYAHPVFFEKSPQYLHHWASLSLILRWLEMTEFEVRFIGLVRNPMAVQYSAVKAFYSSADKRQFSWSHAYRNMLAFKEIVGDNKFFLVRYEDIIKEPKKHFGQVFSFIGLKPYENCGDNVHKDSIMKWRDDPWFSFRLDPSVLQIARYFGYSDDDLYNPLKPKMPIVKNLSKNLTGLIKLNKHRLINRFIKPHVLAMMRFLNLRFKP